MRFLLIDRITELAENDHIAAVRALTLAEDYLADHFPLFPVMPGVMMLESLCQASSWLIRKSEDFAHSIVILREAKNVKYADFVEPGQLLAVTAQVVKQDKQTTTLKGEGRIGEQLAVSARLVMERYNLAERHPARAMTDQFIIRSMRRDFERLYRPAL